MTRTPAWALIYIDDSGESYLEPDADGQPIWVTNDRTEFTLIDREDYYHKPPRHWKRWSTADCPVFPPDPLYQLMAATNFLLWRHTNG